MRNIVKQAFAVGMCGRCVLMRMCVCAQLQRRAFGWLELGTVMGDWFVKLIFSINYLFKDHL